MEDRMRERHKTGSLVFDRARGTWRFLQWVNGKRKSQTIVTEARISDQSIRVEGNKTAGASQHSTDRQHAGRAVQGREDAETIGH